MVQGPDSTDMRARMHSCSQVKAQSWATETTYGGARMRPLSVINKRYIEGMAYARSLRRLLIGPSSSSARVANPLLFASQGLRYRRLEVILTTTIEKLGKAGETVKVAPGHFRNHLMPKLLAVPNIEKYAFLIREQRKHDVYFFGGGFITAGPGVELMHQSRMEPFLPFVVEHHDGSDDQPKIKAADLYQREEEEAEDVTEVPKSEEKLKEDKMKEYQTAAKRLDKSRLVLKRFIKVDNELRSPVAKEELVAEVARQLCVNILPENLHLPSPLASVGEYEVPLRLPRDIPRPEGLLQWTLNVKIRRK